MAPIFLRNAAIFLCAMTCLVVQSLASAFLGAAPPGQGELLLLDELEALVGEGRRLATERRVSRLEEVLRPVFQSMPKGVKGGLAPDGVRYVVHRFFVERHAWYVRGLDAAGDAWNSSSPTLVFKDHDIQGVHAMFDKRLESDGFDLHHVAVLAATLESLVHNETMDRLRAAYRFAGRDINEEAPTESTIDEIVDTYMLLYVSGLNYTTISSPEIKKYFKAIDRVYPAWQESQKWTRGIRQNVLSTSTGLPTSSFDVSLRVVEDIGDQYGRWQDGECKSLKEGLVKLEAGSSGRVHLDEFYAAALEGAWQYSESIDTLRGMGALDETNPQRPSVIIPNYVNAPTNCLASSKFYSVCCIDECEALLGHLETHIAAPQSSPERIAELVASLPSATVKAPRSLPSPLIEKLDQIAAHHGGAVPLHGRLFSQWLHHVFPRECQFPSLPGQGSVVDRVSATTSMGSRTAPEEDMVSHIGAIREQTRNEAVSTPDVPWTLEEELFVAHGPKKRSFSLSRSVLFVVVTGSVGISFAQAMTTVKAAVSKPDKYNV